MRYKPENLRHDMEVVLAKLGTPEDDAKVVSDALLRAEMRGFGSHGILRFPKLISSIEHGFQIKNDGVMFPGEIEEIKEEQNKKGTEIQDEIYNEFKEVVENHM